MYCFAEGCGFGGAVAQTHCRYHVAFGCGAEAGAASAQSLSMILSQRLRSGAFTSSARGRSLFFEYEVYFLHFEVDDVVHYALGAAHAVCEVLIVECGLGSERSLDEGVEVYGQQAAAVIGAEGISPQGLVDMVSKPRSA